MQTAPTNWTALFSAKHKTEYRFLVNGVEYLADDIKGTPTITKKLSDTFTIGQFSCASLTLEIYPKSNIPKAAPVVAYCRLTSTNGSTVTPWVEQGHFWIQSRSSRDGIMSLVCRDASMKAGDSYTDKTSFVDWPQPMTAVVSEIASLMGVEIDSRTVIKTGTDFVVDYPNEDLLMSEILGMIAAAHGGNWIMTEKGKLRLVPMLVTDQPSVFTLGKAYQRFTPLAIPSVITRVTLSDDAGNQFTIGDDSGEEITAECDYATPGVLASIVQDDSIAVENGVLKLNAGSISKGLLNIAAANASIVNGSLTVISRVSYQPYALDGAFVNPLLELGDFFTLNYKGQTYNVLYASANIRLNVSYAADFSLQNKDTTNDEYPYKTARDLKASRYVSTTKTYHGNRINRAEGFVSEYMADGSPIARLIANSNVFSMQQKVNGAWEDRIYFDPVAQRYKIVGDVTVEGSITAEVLATPGGVNITGANITTGTISADRLDFTPINDTIATIQRDLDGLTTKVEDVSSEAIASVVVQYALSDSSSSAPASGWSPIAPAWEAGKYMWQRTVTTFADSTPEEPHVVTSSPTCIQGASGHDGQPGTNGLNVATVFLYQRATSIPEKPTGNIVYTFASGNVSGALGNWQRNIPVTDGKPCYVIQTTASDAGTTDTIDKDRWSSPVILVEDGADGTNGTDGIGIQSVSISYAVTASPPSSVDPTSLLWQSTIPTVPNGSYLWIRTITDYTDSSVSDTVTYTYSRQGVNGQNGQNGQDGTAGYSTAIVYLYKRSATAVTVDWTNDLTYNFADKEIEDTLPSGWYETIPSGANPLYVTMATAYSNTGTDAIAYTEWTPPVILAEDGSAGKGVSSIVPEYYLSTSASSPTDGSWTTTPPAWSSGKYIWTRSHIYYDDSTDATTTPVLDNTVTDFGQKYSEVKQTADKINWLVASGTTAANFTMTSRAISQVAETLSLTATASEGTEVGTLSSETYPSGVYRFSKTSDGYYTSGNGGVNSSVAYGKLTFSFTEDTAVVLKCINRGETIYDFGIVSELDTTLSKDTSEDTTGVLKSFKGLVSEDPVDLTLIIPSGSHFVTFKYKKDSSAHSEGDYFKIKATTQPKPESTLTLKSGQTSLSSAKIVFSGLVTFTDLASAGSTVINGGNITTGKISADRIDTTTLKVDTVFGYDSYHGDECVVLTTNVTDVSLGVYRNIPYPPSDSALSTSIYGQHVNIRSPYTDKNNMYFDTFYGIIHAEGWGLYTDYLLLFDGQDDAMLYFSNNHIYAVFNGSSHIVV